MSKRQTKEQKLRSGVEKIYVIVASGWDGCSVAWVERQLKRLLEATK